MSEQKPDYQVRGIAGSIIGGLALGSFITIESNLPLYAKAAVEALEAVVAFKALVNTYRQQG